MPRIVPVDTCIETCFWHDSTSYPLLDIQSATRLHKMSTRKYSWLALGLASIVVSGCAVGNKPHFNLGIADAFQKSKCCLWKKKLGYNAPAISSKFGYANPVNSAPLHSAAVAMPSTFHAPTLSEVTVLPAQPTVITSPIGTSNGGCSSCCNSCASDTEFYMPTETVSLPTSAEAVNPVPVTSLPFEGTTDSPQLENPLPAAIEAPSNPITPPSDEEEGLIETLDSASIDVEEVDETLEVIPEKDESSILETAAKALKAKTPTSAGESVVDERSKMVILTARPVQSHQRSQIATVQRKQV